MSDYTISHKANRVLNVILLAMLLILIRVWYLGTVQQEYYIAQSLKPQRRVLVERVERATIRDRFNIPLALNKIQYSAAVCYAQIREIPSVQWKKDETGKKVRVSARLAYITELSQILAKELGLDPVRIEDTIHGKASLFPHTPFVIKEDISEEQYYRLRMLERDWVGIRAEKNYKRYYPQNKTAADAVGFMGAINQKEYHRIAQEMSVLQHYLSEREAGELPLLPKGFNNPIEVRERLKELQEKAYTINDLVGKSGIENAFDEQLRGFSGKKTFEVDIKGNFIRELPGSRSPVGGQRVLLTLSSELQEYAEKLLTQREALSNRPLQEDKHPLSTPWIKGGAIVALIPKTGEVVALASYPRIDPNDFVPTQDPVKKRKKQSSLLQWLENEAYIGEIWDGRRPLQRESYSLKENRYVNEGIYLSWEHFLSAILPEDSPVKEAIARVIDVQIALQIQTEMEAISNLLQESNYRSIFQILYSEEKHTLSRHSTLSKKESQEIFKKHKESLAPFKKNLDPFFSSIRHNEDKLLLLDLIRINVSKETFNPPLVQAIGQETLSSYRSISQAACHIQKELQIHIQELFHDLDFAAWRNGHFKEYLKERRKEEKAKKLYTRPYTEYLDFIEKKTFKEFWKTYRSVFLETYTLGQVRFSIKDAPNLQPYLDYLIELRKTNAITHPNLEKLRNALSRLEYPLSISFLKTIRSFEELDRPLLGKYRSLRKTEQGQLEKHLCAAFYPLTGYGYGKSHAFKQHAPLGSVFKLVTAYAGLQERYASLMENQRSLLQLNPLTLVDDLKWNAPGSNNQILGYTQEGQPITRLYKGAKLPRSSHSGIGRVDLIGALEQSSNIYFSLLAAEHLHSREALANAARQFGFGEKSGIEIPGEVAGNIPTDLSNNLTGLYSFAIGQHSLVVTPVQTAVMISTIANQGKVIKPHVVQLIAGKEPLRQEDLLFEASDFPFKEDLSLIGISFPLFTEAKKTKETAYVCYTPTELKRTLFFPLEVREMILEGMIRCVNGPRGSARPGLIRGLYQNPHTLRCYMDLASQMAAKTGTAQILYKQTIDATSNAEMYNHVWFASLSFPHPLSYNANKDPDLAVVVYLRFGEKGGKEAAPLAAAIIQKWREICARHGRQSLSE